MQFAVKDKFVSPTAADRYFAAAGKPKLEKMYFVSHELNDPTAVADRDQWLQEKLQLHAAPAAAVAQGPAEPKVSPGQGARQALDVFNLKFIAACQNMDHPAAAALWAEDGADLLPGMAPMVGKERISRWLHSLTPQLAGAKMVYCTVDWQDIQIHGDLAYEWGINRQKIEFPPPKKSFENEGKILLILKRQGNGSWRIALESWNNNPQPQENL